MVRTQQLQAHETAVEELQAQLADAQQAAGTRGAEAERAIAESACLAAQLAAANQRVEERSAAVKAGEKRSDAAEARAASLAQQLAAVQAKVEEYDGIILDLEQQLSLAENALAARTTEMEAAVARAAAAEGEAAAARERLAEHAKHLDAKVRWRLPAFVGLSSLRATQYVLGCGKRQAASADWRPAFFQVACWQSKCTGPAQNLHLLSCWLCHAVAARCDVFWRPAASRELPLGS